jgi:hypothetical protein
MYSTQTFSSPGKSLLGNIDVRSFVKNTPINPLNGEIKVHIYTSCKPVENLFTYLLTYSMVQSPS